jgi:hypothetical protein
MAFIFGDIESYLKKLSEEVDLKKQQPLVLPNDPSSSKKYDLVICEPDQEEIDDWCDGRSTGWCCYIASYVGYFGNNGYFQKCFDCPEFPEAFKDLENASQALVDYLYDWMLQNDCGYEMEGFIGFYSVNNKIDAIKLLKQCPVIGKIYEIDDQDNIIATY